MAAPSRRPAPRSGGGPRRSRARRRAASARGRRPGPRPGPRPARAPRGRRRARTPGTRSPGGRAAPRAPRRGAARTAPAGGPACRSTSASRLARSSAAARSSDSVANACIALTSSWSALMAVLKWNSSMSVVTRWMVSWIVRRKARPGAERSDGRAEASRERGPMRLEEAPHAVQEAEGALHPLVAPLEVLLGRGHEELEHPTGVGAVGDDEVVGAHDVALGLRHLGAVLHDHALGEQVLERLVELEVAEVAQDLRVEAGVEEVQDGVLDAARVLVDGHPVVDGLRVGQAARGAAASRTGGSTRRSPRRCPSCRSRAGPAPRSGDTSC